VSDALCRGGRVVMTAPATVAMMVAVLQAGCHSTEPVRSNEAPATLHVTVLGITPGRGVVRCALYADRATFLTRGGITEGFSVPATTERAEFELHARSGQAVVVSVFQDLDSNEELNRGAFGIPSEPWGFSGKPAPLLPPSWSACAMVPVAGDNRLEMHLIGKAR
jgi:uncharacterized protein (DUF2141 family)